VLSVTNVSGNLKSGDSFLLFKTGSGGYVNNFTGSPTLPLLGPGLSWNSTLTSNGRIFVTGTLAPPAISSVSLSGTTLSVSGTGGIPNGQYVLLTSTNISEALSSWTKLATNSFTLSGAFSTSVLNATNIQQYFLLEE
jgi:hypothetical protein